MLKLCEFKNCTEKAIYASYYNNPIYCRFHKTDTMRGRYLIYMCGSARPSFNYEGETKAIYCSKCKKTI